MKYLFHQYCLLHASPLNKYLAVTAVIHSVILWPSVKINIYLIFQGNRHHIFCQYTRGQAMVALGTFFLNMNKWAGGNRSPYNWSNTKRGIYLGDEQTGSQRVYFWEEQQPVQERGAAAAWRLLSFHPQLVDLISSLGRIASSSRHRGSILLLF